MGQLTWEQGKPSGPTQQVYYVECKMDTGTYTITKHMNAAEETRYMTWFKKAGEKYGKTIGDICALKTTAARLAEEHHEMGQTGQRRAERVLSEFPSLDEGVQSVDASGVPEPDEGEG